MEGGGFGKMFSDFGVMIIAVIITQDFSKRGMLYNSYIEVCGVTYRWQLSSIFMTQEIWCSWQVVVSFCFFNISDAIKRIP